MNKFVFALLAALALPAHAQVSVASPWIRATVPAQKSTGAFLQITSAKDARLVGVSTPAAGIAELHQMESKGDMMRMHPVEAIELPAGKAVNMASGGYHVMLQDLKQQLKEGDTVVLTLVVEHKDKKRESVTVKVPVKPLTFQQ
ncbi:MAG: copper chaperone PCu(A)C [Pseudomonadota bacterium]